MEVIYSDSAQGAIGMDIEVGWGRRGRMALWSLISEFCPIGSPPSWCRRAEPIRRTVTQVRC